MSDFGDQLQRAAMGWLDGLDAAASGQTTAEVVAAALRDERARLRAAVEALHHAILSHPGGQTEYPDLIRRSAVLALLPEPE